MKKLITAIIFLSIIVGCDKETAYRVSASSINESVTAIPVVNVTFWCYGLDGQEQWQVHFTADSLKTNDIISVYYQVWGAENGWDNVDWIIDIPHNQSGNEYGTYLRAYRLGCEGRLKVTVKRNSNVVASDIQPVHCEMCSAPEKKKPPCEGCAHQ